MAMNKADLEKAIACVANNRTAPNGPVFLPPTLYRMGRLQAEADGKLQAFDAGYRELMPLPFCGHDHRVKR